MRLRKIAGSALAIIAFSIIFSVGLIVTMSSLLLDVSEPAHKIDVLNSDKFGSVTLNLPTSSFERDDQDGNSINGNFKISTGSGLDPVYIFLPYYVGTITILVEKENVYVSPLTNGSRVIPRVKNAAVEVLSVDQIQKIGPMRTVEVVLSVQSDGGGLAVLPEIYVGKAQDFQTLLQRSYLYYDVIRNAVLGVQIFILLLGIALINSVSERHDFFAPLLIIAYLTSYGVGAVISQIRPDLDTSTYIVPSTPAISLALFVYGWRLCRGSTLDRYSTAIYSVIFMWFCFIIVANYLDVNLRVMNVFISGPSIIVALTLVTIMCVNTLSIMRSVEVQMMLFGVVLLMLLVAHDVTFRVGLHSNGIAMSPLGSLAFFAVLSYSSSRQYLISQKGLAKANDTLTESLKSQSNKLILEFEKTADLMKIAAAQEETVRMTRELHDGVLTYLGLINIISDSDSADSKEKIRHLSRIATNEIRVIMESRPNENASLAIALSSLRQNMVDPLSLQNIDVEWSIAELLNYGPLAPRQLMDVVRVIQEAIHNAVVRAECKFLSVTAERSEGTYRIRIINLGGNTYSHEEKTGRGIANMKERAARLGGALSIHPKDTGASLLLTLPSLNA